ncbi:MAG: 1-acyl-sn-glycerol-3-phosphate acyltransferase [Muribaculum sp.]|nr:1-acyl-sn-glycerol-3-phosphate acyltransferase [Muribaculaceae bacterium]MCM1080859.1 1-acyl-sn-glycerol-3-phosphate acyltransferase [Muribaculum sp.]
MKMFFYRLYQLLIAGPILLVATILTASAVIILSCCGLSRWAGNTVPTYWARLFCTFMLVKVTVEGRENIDKKTSYVFVCNHQGAYDIFSVYGYLNHPFRWMMKASLGKIPLVGYSCKISGHIMVDNSSPSATRHTMEVAERQLRGGMSIVVFPEGSRTPDGLMHRFKRGAFLLAEEFGLPVVPISIDGSFKVMPRFKKLPVPGHIHMHIYKPINAVDGRHNIKEVIEQSHRIILESLPESKTVSTRDVL